MADKFKRFIETGGKSAEEIRQEIQRLLRGAVEEVVTTAENAADAVDETIRTAAEDIRRRISEVVADASADKPKQPERIPPRERDNIRYAPSRREKTLSADEIAFAPDRFPIKITDADRAINAKIAEMRSLNEIFYNGYLVQQCAELSIVRQGEFMADVEDNYEHKAFCAIPRPVYGAMSNSQLRTYFTWRTNARKGIFAETDQTYIVLYCYELLNKVGVLSAAEAMGRLLEVWEHCKGFAPEVKRRLPRWIKDFYAYNDVSEQYPDISVYFSDDSQSGCENDLFEHRYAGHLDYFAEHSAYDFKSSAFMTEDILPLLDGALSAVWSALDDYFAGQGLSLFRLICGRMKKDYGWEAFAGAYVDKDRMDGFREVKISSVECYSIKRGVPALETFEAAPFRGFIGYVIKLTESVLRKRMGFRHKITPNINMALKEFTNLEKHIAAVSDPRFVETVTLAANEWCGANHIAAAPKKTSCDEVQPAEPIKVEIDIAQLARIREESDEIAKRLIVEETEGVSAEEISDIAQRVSDEDYSERIADYSERDDFTEPAEQVQTFDFSELPKMWRGFAESLTVTQIEVLAALTRGTAEEYCRRYGIFPETVYEQINTAALDATGDIVIEGGELIPDYEKNIKKIIAAADV